MGRHRFSQSGLKTVLTWKWVFKDAFWRNFLGHGPALNSPLVPRQTPLPRSAASQPRFQRSTPRRPHLPIEPALPEPTVFYDHLSYYATLEFDASSLDDFPSDDELKLSRFKLQTIHHPDVPGGSAKLSARINQAFDALSSGASSPLTSAPLPERSFD